MAWITPPIFKPGDAEADLAGADPRRRQVEPPLQEARLREADRAERERVPVLAACSARCSRSTRRRGPATRRRRSRRRSTKSSTRCGATGRPRPRWNARATSSRRRSVGGLETLGGFGGVADRLNAYNHYLGTPDYLPQDLERYRKATPATVKQFVVDQLSARRARGRARRRRAAGLRPGGAEAEGRPRRRRAPAPSRVNADEPWRKEQPQAGRREAAGARGAAVVHAAERPHRDPERAARAADRLGQPRRAHRQRRQPDREAGAGELHGRDARRGHRDAQRAAARR